MTGGFIFIWTITTSGLDFHKVQSHIPLKYLNLKVTLLAPHWTWLSEQEPFHKILARPSHMEIERWPPLPLKICTNPRQGCEGRIWQQCWYKQPLILATYISIVCCFVIWPHWVVVVIPLFSVSYHSSAFATKLGEGWRQNWKYRFGWNCQYDFQNAHGITKSLELEDVWEMSQTGQSLLYLKKRDYVWNILNKSSSETLQAAHISIVSFMIKPQVSWVEDMAFNGHITRVRNCPYIQYQTLFSDYVFFVCFVLVLSLLAFFVLIKCLKSQKWLFVSKFKNSQP